jgi:PAS domain S-box-containing protein
MHGQKKAKIMAKSGKNGPVYFQEACNFGGRRSKFRSVERVLHREFLLHLSVQVGMNMCNVSPFVTKLREINSVFSRQSSRKPVSELFRSVCEKIVELLDVDHATITFLDGSRRFFRIEAEYPTLATSLIGERIVIEDRASQLDLLHHHKPIVVNELYGHALTTESASFCDVVRQHDIQSLLIVPMLADGNTIGTIGIDLIGRTKAFSEEEIEFSQAIATLTASLSTIASLRDEQDALRREAKLIVPHNERTSPISRYERLAEKTFDDLAGVIEFDKASLQLIVEGRRTLIGARGFQRSEAQPRLLRPVPTDPIISDIVRTKKLKCLPDTSVIDEWETKDVKSWIGVPLVFQEETIGIVTLDHRERGFYSDISESTRASLEELVSRVAYEIGSAYKLDMAQNKIRALEIIRLFAEKVAIKLDPNDLLLAIVSAISNGLECTRCSILLAEQHDGVNVLVLKASCEGDLCRIESTQVLSHYQPPGSPCPMYYALKYKKSVLVNDLRDELRFTVTGDALRDVRSMIVVPLMIADQSIGVVSAVHTSPGRFATWDQLLLETLSRQATMAIERDFGLDVVHSIATKMLGAMAVDSVLKEIVSGAIRLAHMDSGVIYELNEDGTEVIGSFMNEGSIHPSPRLGESEGIIQTVISSRRMLEIPDIARDSRVNPELRGRYRSMFACPLLLGESVVGVLYLNSRIVRTLTETERSLLKTLAGHAALAIQRTRLYEHIRDSEAMYRSLLDHIPQFVFRKDTNSRFTSGNASFCANLSKNLDEILGKSDFDFYPKEDAEKYIRDDKEVMQTRRSKVQDEKNQPIGAKTPIWVRVVKTPVLDAAGDVIGVQAIFWDITEEKQMTERWQSLVEQSPDAIVVHVAGEITFANPTAVRLFGVACENELKGRSILDFIDESTRGQAEKRLAKLIKKEAVPAMEELRVRQENTAEIIDVEVYSQTGTEDEIQAVFHDVTRTKTVLREMHHRVRRSLNEVDGILTLQEEYTADPHVLHAFDTIRERIQALALVHKTLFRTNTESDVDMYQYLRDLIDALLGIRRVSRKITIDYSVERAIILDEKRATACGLIVTELVSNSLVHAFPNESGRIAVVLRSVENAYQLIVADNGVGLQVATADSGESMGLSLVRSLVRDDLKGMMFVSRETTCVGLPPGARFNIEFPRMGIRRTRDDGR